MPEQHQISLTTRQLNVSVTTSETDDDARHRRRKDMILFVTALGFVGLLAIVAAWEAFAGSGDAKQHEWGMGVLLLTVGGCIGFLTGKNVK